MEAKELHTAGEIEEDNVSVTDEAATMLLNDGNDNDGNDNVQETEVDVDTFIEHAGNFGRYQILIMIMITISAFPTSYPVLLFYFIGHGPSWRCEDNTHPVCYNDTSIHDPEDATRCRINRTQWTYDHANKSTIVTEFDLVCDRAWLDALSGSSAFIGWGLGILVTGYISDQYGRKKVMFSCLGLMLITMMGHYFVTGIWMLIILRFIMGVFFSAPALLQFVMLVELIAPKYRVIACNVCQFAWPIAAGLLVLKAYYLNSWRTLCLLCSAPYFVVLLTAFFVPESVRWLHTKGRKHAAQDILRRVARTNRKSLPPNLTLKDIDDTATLKKVTYWDMVRRKRIFKQILAQGFIWFHCGLTYYALNWEFADIGGDMYINSILSFLVELPGNVIIILTLQRFGRKRMNLIFSALTALACLAVACMPKTESLKHVRLVFGLLGKCFISCLFGGIYMWSSELFATVTRTQGMAIMIVTSRIGAAMSPFIKLLYKLHPSAPFTLMTATSAVATLLCVTLSETVNQKTRETLEEMLETHTVMTELPVVTDFNENLATAGYNRFENEVLMDDENVMFN